MVDYTTDNRGVATKACMCVNIANGWILQSCCTIASTDYIKSDTTAISHATCKKNDFFLYNTKGGDESSQNGQKMSRQVL